MKRKTVHLISGKTYSVFLTRKQQNMDFGFPPLYSSWGCKLFLYSKTFLYFDVLGA